MSRVKQLTGIDLTGQYGPGLAFNNEEREFIEIKRGLEYINFFAYTNVKQKTIDPKLAREIVAGLLARGFNVCTSPQGMITIIIPGSRCLKELGSITCTRILIVGGC
mgnify:CR=1 FL=1